MGTRVLQGAGVAVFLSVVPIAASALGAWGGKGPAGWLMTAGIVLSVAVAGGLGGAVYYATDGLRAADGWRKTMANVASLLAYALFLFGVLVLAVALGIQ